VSKTVSAIASRVRPGCRRPPAGVLSALIQPANLSELLAMGGNRGGLTAH
jgi:hypothetical protein